MTYDQIGNVGKEDVVDLINKRISDVRERLLGDMTSYLNKTEECLIDGLYTLLELIGDKVWDEAAFQHTVSCVEAMNTENDPESFEQTLDDIYCQIGYLRKLTLLKDLLGV